jgi:mRNA interferase MazF
VASTTSELVPGGIVWASMDPVRGTEQGGHRPHIVIANPDYLETVTSLAVLVPVTTRRRDWPNHVALSGPHGLARPSWAMPEQVRAVSRDRITKVGGAVDTPCLDEIRMWVADFLDIGLPPAL